MLIKVRIDGHSQKPNQAIAKYHLPNPGLESAQQKYAGKYMPKDQKKVRAINEKITDFVRKFFEKKGFVPPPHYPLSKKRERLTIFIESKSPRASQTKSARRHDTPYPAFTFTNLMHARTAQSYEKGERRKNTGFCLLI